MKENEESVHKEIGDLLATQRLAVLATERTGQPYTSLMAFAYTPDLKTIVVATGASTRKHINLMTEARVSLLIDNRSNSESDFHAATALTVVGNASPVSKGLLNHYKQLYLARHNYLTDFLKAPTTTIFQISVRHYLLVTLFQKVMEYHLTDEKDIFS